MAGSLKQPFDFPLYRKELVAIIVLQCARGPGEAREPHCSPPLGSGGGAERNTPTVSSGHNSILFFQVS